jgi:hypothetical protein
VCVPQKRLDIRCDRHTLYQADSPPTMMMFWTWEAMVGKSVALLVVIEVVVIAAANFKTNSTVADTERCARAECLCVYQKKYKKRMHRASIFLA